MVLAEWRDILNNNNNKTYTHTKYDRLIKKQIEGKPESDDENLENWKFFIKFPFICITQQPDGGCTPIYKQ